MKLIKFLFIQALLLGSCAYAAWALVSAHDSRLFRWSVDTFAAACVGIVLTAIFLVMVATPAQLAIGRSAPLSMRLVTGIISGPVGVWLGMTFISSYPVSWEWYVYRAWTLHIVYTGVGLGFAWAWHLRQRSDGQLEIR